MVLNERQLQELRCIYQIIGSTNYMMSSLETLKNVTALIGALSNTIRLIF